MVKSLVNNKLEILREYLNLSNRDFANKLSIHETMYTKIKKGNYPIGAKTMGKIQKAFPEHNIDWILYGVGDEKKMNKIINKYATEMLKDIDDFVAASSVHENKTIPIMDERLYESLVSQINELKNDKQVLKQENMELKQKLAHLENEIRSLEGKSKSISA